MDNPVWLGSFIFTRVECIEILSSRKWRKRRKRNERIVLQGYNNKIEETRRNFYDCDMLEIEMNRFHIEKQLVHVYYIKLIEVDHMYWTHNGLYAFVSVWMRTATEFHLLRLLISCTGCWKYHYESKTSPSEYIYICEWKKVSTQHVHLK